MYPFLPRCAVHGKECEGIVILQKSCMNQVLWESKFFSQQNSVAQAFRVTKQFHKVEL